MVAGHFRYTQYTITLVSAFTQRALAWLPALDSIISQLGMATPLARWAAAVAAAATVPKPTLLLNEEEWCIGEEWCMEAGGGQGNSRRYALCAFVQRVCVYVTAAAVPSRRACMM